MVLNPNFLDSQVLDGVVNSPSSLRPYTAADFRRQDESDDQGFYNAQPGHGGFDVLGQARCWLFIVIDSCNSSFFFMVVHRFSS
jgi:hypothetical protein